MFRCFKALPLALALAALSIFTASCGPNNPSDNIPAQVRFVNAIQDTAQYGTALDIAGRGIADPSSLLAALAQAAAMAARRAALAATV